MSFTPTEEQIRAQFVTSLMEYFKIEENVTLRAHVADLIRNIRPQQYREFFRRLSLRQMPYKNGFEKIALIAAEFDEDTLTIVEQEAIDRTNKLHSLVYDLRRMISEVRDPNKSALERFELIRFTSLKLQGAETLLLDKTDINVIKTLTKQWLYDYVSLDRSLFNARVTREYSSEIIRRDFANNTPRLLSN